MAGKSDRMSEVFAQDGYGDMPFSENIEDKRDQPMGTGEYLLNLVPHYLRKMLVPDIKSYDLDPDRPVASPLAQEAGYYDIGRPEHLPVPRIKPLPMDEMRKLPPLRVQGY
jgi:hypothetical protein